MLNKDFFMGGNATFTVQNPAGEYYTYKIRQPKGINKPFFVSLLTGPDNENSFTYIGIAEEIRIRPFVKNMELVRKVGAEVSVMTVRLTKNSKYTEDTKPVKVVRWALQQVWLGNELPEGYQIRHEGRCGCCGRKLTTPESLDRGIGPECFARMGMGWPK